MAQPDEAQPDKDEMQFGPDQHIVDGFRIETRPGPRGGKFLVAHCFNRREALLFDISDEAEAERVANELKPSRVARTNGAGPKGLVLP